MGANTALHLTKWDFGGGMIALSFSINSSGLKRKWNAITIGCLVLLKVGVLEICAFLGQLSLESKRNAKEVYEIG